MALNPNTNPVDPGPEAEPARPIPRTAATEEWANEGGSVAPLHQVTDPELTDFLDEGEEILETEAEAFESEVERLSFGRTKRKALLLFTGTACILFVILVVIAQLIY